MKSKSTVNVRPAAGIGDVVRPREVTYCVTFHQWFSRGASARRVFPTIWVHMWSVAYVSFHESRGSSGHSPRCIALSGCRCRLEEQGIYVAPCPVFAGFEASNHGVLSRLEVLGGVLSWRAVTAADVTAGEAQSQVNPAAAGLEALLASIWGIRFNRSNLRDVRAAVGRHNVGPGIKGIVVQSVGEVYIDA